MRASETGGQPLWRGEYKPAMSLVESGDREEDLLEGIACPLQEFIAA